MAITLVGLGTEATGNNASLTLTLPTVQNDDVIFALLTGRNGTTGAWAAPAGQGWALLYSVRSTVAGGSLYLFGKRWATGDPTTAAFTWSGGGTNQTTLGQSLAMRGYPTALPIDSTALPLVFYTESASSNYSQVSIGNAIRSGDPMLCIAFANNDVANTSNAAACRMVNASGGAYATELGDQTASSLGTDSMQSLWAGLGTGDTPQLLWAVDVAAAAVWIGFKVRPEAQTFTAQAYATVTCAGDFTIDPVGNLGAVVPARCTANGDPFGASFAAIGSPLPQYRVAGAQASSTSLGAVNFVVPASAQVDDLLLAVIAIYNSGATAPRVAGPAGWTAESVIGNNYRSVGVFSRRCVTGDPGSSFAFTFPSEAATSLDKTGRIHAFSSVNWGASNQWSEAEVERQYEYPGTPYRTAALPGATAVPTLVLDVYHTYEALRTPTDFTLRSDTNTTNNFIRLSSLDTVNTRGSTTYTAQFYAHSDTLNIGESECASYAARGKALDYGQFWAEKRTYCTVTATGELYQYDPVMLPVDATCSVTGPAYIELLLSDEGVAFEGVANCIAYASNPTLRVDPIPFFYAGLTVSYSLEPVIVSRDGQRVTVTVDGATWPVKQLTIRTGAALVSEAIVRGIQLGTAPQVGQLLIVSLTAEVEGTVVTSAIYSGLITSVRDSFSEWVATASIPLTARPPQQVVPEKVQNVTGNMVRGAPDFFHQPGDLLDGLFTVDSMVTTLGTNQGWFTEYRHG